MKKYEKTYGKEGAKVRNRIFKRILAKAQDGTKAGQWSARKAQSLAEDYEKAMGKKGKKPYKSSKKTKSQKSLKDWGDQDWKTKSGKKSSKTGERYLPAKAIDSLSDEEYNKTSAKKRKDMKKGKQFSDQPKSIAKKTKKYRAEFESEYQPNQTLSDYNPEQLTESSAIEGFQPLKYSVVGNRAETFEAKDGSWCVNHGWIHNTKIGDIIPCTSCNDMICGGCRCGGCGNCENADCCECKNAETFESESSKPHSVTISRSSNSEKKLMAVFEDSEGKKMKTTHFGQRGASDYTKHGEKERMERYLERHGGGFETSTKENWKDPTTAGALSRWILWNKPSLKASFDDYKSRFGLKGSIKVSKSAEEKRQLISELVCFKCGVKDEIANYNWNENAKGCCGMGVREKQYYAKSAETFEATEWVGFCPECNKWRTKEMSVKIDSKVGIGWSIPDELVGKRLCRKSQRFGKITNHSSSWSGYGQRTHEDSYCGTPLTKVKSKYKAETFENESKFPTFQFAGAVLLVSLLPLFLDNRRDKV